MWADHPKFIIAFAVIVVGAAMVIHWLGGFDASGLSARSYPREVTNTSPAKDLSARDPMLIYSTSGPDLSLGSSNSLIKARW
ncbi:MAG: hypothetical protein AAF441_22555 [Pseudomonadota bacterium]